MGNKNVTTGLRFGLIIGVVYALFLYWRWTAAQQLIMFGIIAAVAYVVVLGLMFYEAYYRKKQNDGYIDLKNLFQTLFISVLIFELIYTLYNFIHIKYIDPEVITRMKSGIEQLLDKAGGNISEAKREEALKELDELDKSVQFVPMLRSYISSIAVSGVFAFIISLIMRKRKPVFEELT